MKTQVALKLPKQDDFRRYKMSDGSIIYPSGGDFVRDGVPIKMPNAGKFLLWVKDGEEVINGNLHTSGHFVMDHDGPRYYPQPIQAMSALEEIHAARTP